MVEDLGTEEGLDEFKKPTKIALVDADTIVYAACSVNEYLDEHLPKEFYQYEEWKAIITDPQYDEEAGGIWVQHTSAAIEASVARIEGIIEATFTKSAELYFTSGKNFRHAVDPMYKGNRTGRYPPGLKEVKMAMLEKYPGCIGDGVEADDIVVYLKRTNPDKYVLCAVDKDVLQSVPGKHWNYYRSDKYHIEPKWIEVTKESAEQFPYFQCLMGDTTDNIRGCPGIGKKTAAKLLKGITTNEERWDVVVETFKKKGLTAKDALQTMRLVNCHQIDENYKWHPYTQPIGV